jgi:hypothetical protein
MKFAILAALAATAAAEGPCDIYLAAGTPCVAAHSTVRALYSAFSGSLYQVMRSVDKATKDIPVLTVGGFANSAMQDEFCKDSACTINRIYDQSPQKNHLDTAPGGGACHNADVGCNATAKKLIVGGHPVYAAHFINGNGYRNDKTSGIAKGDEPETMYMVTAGKYFNGGCCFDYGNAETDNLDDGAGTMEAVYFGNAKGGLNHGGAGKGPWIMADMENALWGADIVKSNEPPINHDFVTAMVKGDASKHVGVPGAYTEGVDYPMNDIAPCGIGGCTLPKNSTHMDCESKCTAAVGCIGYVFADEPCSGKAGPMCWTKSAMDGDSQASCRNARVLGGIPGHWAIKGGDAQAGKLSVYWDGRRAPGYAPMKKQGAIILGIGGDNSCSAVGTFYEGVMTKGYTSDAADDAVQANIVAAGYKALPADAAPIFM